ncbi:MAG TPA: hypothetical protein VKU62_06280, partial [Thermoanaerobaculia bacterium]|nr:hypothetical protein [Thermoanaerobaculia bacterium]
FAPAIIASCRVLKSRGDEDGEAPEPRSGRGADHSQLTRAIELLKAPSHLILLYERDNAPARVQRQVEKAGLVIVCNKPFDSQLPQFAGIFARRLGLKIGYATADALTERYGANLAAIAAARQQPDEFVRSGAADLGADLFQISESLSGDLPLMPLAMIDRAAATPQADHPVATISSTRGDILARMGRNQEAEAAFRDEMQRFPRTTDAYMMLALLLASEHRFSEIDPTLEAMVKASPMPATYFLAAREMHDLGNEEGSRFFRSQGEQMLRAERPSRPQ